MPSYTNRAAGPRVLNLKGGVQKVLLVGETADVELAAGPDKDPVLKAMLESGELDDGSKGRVSGPVGFDPEQYQKDMEELVKLRSRVGELEAIRAESELDSSRRTPPRQFGSDGGPQQGPTVDGQGGDLTPSQEEQGRQEPPRMGVGPSLVARTATEVQEAQGKEKRAAEREEEDARPQRGRPRKEQE